jgi:uncharacterized protein (DUF342 family)
MDEIERFYLDVESFKQRIHAAEEKLKDLPTHSFNWQEQRKLDSKRQGLLTEIKVLKQRIAKSALNDD